ncbi:uncharacterized protein METZ01_LOCUS240217, partial [marine metagenome]
VSINCLAYCVNSSTEPSGFLEMFTIILSSKFTVFKTFIVFIFLSFIGINLVISSSNSIFEAINIKKKIKTHNTPKLSSFLESIN